LILIVRRILAKSDEKRERGWSWTCWLFAGALIYYPLLHAAMGSPMYSRMMLPALPPAALLLGCLIVRGAKAISLDRSRFLRGAGWFLFAMLLVLGVRHNANRMSKPDVRDDVPQIAHYLNQLPGEGSVIFSNDMNRELMFYLHGNSIKRKQFKWRPQKLARFVEQYPERRLYLALRTTEMKAYKTLVNTLAPRYRIEPVLVTSRRFIRLYEIVPDAEFKVIGGKPHVKFIQEETTVATPVTVGSVEQALVQYVEHILGCEGKPSVRVLPYGDGGIEHGRLKRLELSAPGTNIRGVRTKSLELTYDDVEIDLVRLLALHHLVIKKAGSAKGVISIEGSALSEFLQSKNRNIPHMHIQLDDDLMIIRGIAWVIGNPLKFELKGELSLDEKGGVFFHPTRGSWENILMPPFILRMVERAINPAFVAEVRPLGLTASGLKITKGRLEFELH